MNRSESKYFNTAVKMDEALLSLLEEKDFPYITVKEICQRAGVNRSTFYLHYETIGDLLSESVDYILGDFEAQFQFSQRLSNEQIQNLPMEQLILVTPEYLIPFLEFAEKNQRLFRIAASRPESIHVSRIFNRLYADLFFPVMKRFGLRDYEIDYKLVFYLEGMFAVVCRWISGGCRESVDIMADLLVRCVFPTEYFREQT